MYWALPPLTYKSMAYDTSRRTTLTQRSKTYLPKG